MMSVASSSSFDTESITVPMEYVCAPSSHAAYHCLYAYYDIKTDGAVSQTISFSSPDVIEEVGCIRA
jgi:hypothetical protein